MNGKDGGMIPGNDGNGTEYWEWKVQGVIRIALTNKEHDSAYRKVWKYHRLSNFNQACMREPVFDRNTINLVINDRVSGIDGPLMNGIAIILCDLVGLRKQVCVAE